MEPQPSGKAEEFYHLYDNHAIGQYPRCIRPSPSPDFSDWPIENNRLPPAAKNIFDGRQLMTPACLAVDEEI
jgi:hypothetical protein